MIVRSSPGHNFLGRIGWIVPNVAIGAETSEPERSRPMSEARDQRVDDTTFIPPDGPAMEAIAGDSAAAAARLAQTVYEKVMGLRPLQNPVKTSVLSG